MKAVTDYKAALAVQRPFFKPVSEMSYSYTPQMHFCILLSKKKALHLLAREAKDLSVSAWINKIFLAFTLHKLKNFLPMHWKYKMEPGN